MTWQHLIGPQGALGECWGCYTNTRTSAPFAAAAHTRNTASMASRASCTWCAGLALRLCKAMSAYSRVPPDPLGVGGPPSADSVSWSSSECSSASATVISSAMRRCARVGTAPMWKRESPSSREKARWASPCAAASASAHCRPAVAEATSACEEQK
eukprot:1177288-Prorocentrum_minimum.AAC.2